MSCGGGATGREKAREQAGVAAATATAAAGDGAAGVGDRGRRRRHVLQQFGWILQLCKRIANMSIDQKRKGRFHVKEKRAV